MQMRQQQQRIAKKKLSGQSYSVGLQCFEIVLNSSAGLAVPLPMLVMLHWLLLVDVV